MWDPIACEDCGPLLELDLDAARGMAVAAPGFAKQPA